MSATTLQLSDYKILDSLGQGGNAFVWRATNKESEFALKQLKSDHSRSFKEKKQRFIDETQSVLKVQNHIRGVLPIIDCALPDARGNYWYTMPVATPILKKNPELSLDEKTQAVIELADTMVLLHARGIVHRDIKPRNLYFYEGHYCLGDFGLVDYPDKSDVTRSHETVGPRFSIAPEMKRDAKNADGKKADVYSLAKTLWMLLTGNDTGFEGMYIADDRLIGLRFRTEFRTEHLVELEALLSDATKEDPDSRPTMSAFSQRLNEWLLTKADWKESCLSQWRYIQRVLFSEAQPNSATWTSREKIVAVLNLIGKMPNLNHMFYPDGGGSDFEYAELATESGCIYIHTDCGSAILKPSRLLVETFENGFIWNYFRLELEQLKPIFKKGQYAYEELTEDTPGHYVSWKCGNYGYYEDDSPLPEKYRNVCRYLSGSFVFFLKPSPYNYISMTYDARHNTMNAEGFRQYIESLKQKYDQFCSRFEGQNISDLPHHFAGCIAETERQQKRLANSEHTNAILAAAKLQSDFEDWVEMNHGVFNFKPLCEPQTNSGSKLVYHIEFFINRTMDVFEVRDYCDNRRFLYANGKVLKESAAKQLNLEKYALYSIESARKLISDCFGFILEQYGDKEKVDASCTSSDFFSIKIHRIAPPAHLFTKEEIGNVMRVSDDSIDNVLVIDADGFALVVPARENYYLYPVRHEIWCAYNNYVGKHSSLSSLDDDYLGSLEGWLKHLQTGESAYVDAASREQTEISLIADIRKYYQNEAEERR